MPDPFNEDFFERVIDVQWIEEKKVYWMAGDTQGATHSSGSKYYTSDDGIHWESHASASGGNAGLYGYTSGLWMRESFKPAGKPLWIIGGSGIQGNEVAAGLQTSTDGLALSGGTWFDSGGYPGWFVSQFFVDPAHTPAGLQARLETASFSRFSTYTSDDGLSWSGSSRQAPSTAKFDILADHEVMATHSVEVGVSPSMRTPPVITPFQTSSQVKSSNDLYQLSNRAQASGTLRSGPFAGKTVTIKGGQPHGFHGPGTPGYDYFEPKCTVADSKTGKMLKKSTNCGLTHGHSIAYGYYVFVAAGDVGKQSALSFTVDGITWNTQTFSSGQSMWSLVAGPRK